MHESLFNEASICASNEVVEIRVLSGCARKSKDDNEYIIGLGSIENQMREAHLMLFGHINSFRELQ